MENLKIFALYNLKAWPLLNRRLFEQLEQNMAKLRLQSEKLDGFILNNCAVHPGDASKILQELSRSVNVRLVAMSNLELTDEIAKSV